MPPIVAPVGTALGPGVAMPAAPEAGGHGRLVHLDALRAFAMLFGVPVHAATLAGPRTGGEAPLLAAAQGASDLFRMAAFFFIAGFFTLMALGKTTPGAFLRSRLTVLGLPFLAALVLLVPVTNWMIHVWHNGPLRPVPGLAAYLSGGWRAGTAGNDTWALHLWFLLSLGLFALLAPALARLLRAPAVARALARVLDRAGPAGLPLLALATGCGMAAGAAADQVLLRPLLEGTRAEWIVRASLIYLPVFTLGLLACAEPRALGLLSRLSLPALLAFGAAHAAVPLADGLLPPAAGRLLYWVTKGALSVTVVAGLIWLCARLVPAPRAWLGFLVGAAYPFYLLHFTAIYAVAWALLPLTRDAVLLWLGAVLLAPPLTLAVWAFAIRPVPLLRTLFTGRLPQGRSA